MGEVIELINMKLESMIDEYKHKILVTPNWQLDNLLPVEIRSKDFSEKINYLIGNYKNQNALYVLLKKDLKIIEEKKGAALIEELKKNNLDPRFFEGMGLKQDQINEYFEFRDKIVNSLS